MRLCETLWAEHYLDSTTKFRTVLCRTPGAVARAYCVVVSPGLLVGDYCGGVVLQYPHDCALEDTGGEREHRRGARPFASGCLVAEHGVECPGGLLGDGAESPRLWLSAQSVVLW